MRHKRLLLLWLMIVLPCLSLLINLARPLYAQPAGTITGSWTDPNGSGLTVKFYTPNTYESCTSTADRIYTEGIPANWSLTGTVELYWAIPTNSGGTTFETIQSYPVAQNGNLDLTITYPPAATWPDLSAVGNPLRELHIAPSILVRDQNRREVSWLGNDLTGAPSILGPGQVWDVICLLPPNGNTPTPSPTNTPIGGTAALGDRVWNDTNRNGVQDIGEPGVSGVTVELLAACTGNTVLATRTTNVNGTYLFNNLAAGQYRVRFTLPSGFSAFSPKDAIADDDYDSDVNVGGMTDCISLSIGEQNYRVDAGLLSGTPTPTPTNTPITQLGSIGDRVWRDNNSNGVQDSGEPGVAGISVQLRDCSGAILSNTTTNSSGIYTFPNLNAGCYIVRFINISGFTISPANQGGDDTLDSDVTQLDSVTPGILNGQTDPINLAQGENNPTIDAGLIPQQPVLGSIGDRVWRDDDGDTVQDSGEPGINGVTVVLRNPGANNTCEASDAVIATQVTTGDGNYLFGGLAAGRYCVDPDQNTVPAGYALTTNNDPTTADLAAGQNRTDVDFGYRPPAQLGSIGDRVWRDDNQDGIQNAGEPGIPGVTVQLKDCNGNVLQSDITDNNGIYGFNNLAAGCYRVTVLPNGFQISPQDQGGDDTRDSDINPANGTTNNINLAAGENNPTIDAGLFTAALVGSIGDRVWRDDDGDTIQDSGEPGINGVTVVLRNPGANNTCEATDAVIATQVTTGDGNYLFGGLAAGRYCVDPDQNTVPAGYALTTNNDPTTADLAAGQNRTDVDFGYRPPAQLGSIGDRVWRDDDGDAVQDSGEPGINGVTVVLRNPGANNTCEATDAVIATQVTTGDGNYLFGGLAAGRYCVDPDQNTVPAGYALTTNNDPTTADLAAGQNRTDVDFGYRPQLACGLAVDQKCVVTASPPPSNFSCSAAKPLNELSMIWNGTQTVDVRAWKGSVGSTLLATVTNVAPGTKVVVTGYAGAPNDVIWEIFAAGTTNKLGESTFHLSCSDENMNGPEDCGAIQGDGKAKTGFLNLWTFDGMAGNGQRLSCSSTPTVPADSCSIVAGSGSVCSGSKPKSLTFRYTGGSCAASNNPQSGKFTCSGSPGSGAVTITLTGKDASKFSVTPSTVNPGQEVTIARTDGGDFPSDTKLQVGGQALTIHTSCSQALNLGDIFGSLTLIGADGRRLDTPVTFSYLVSNSGNSLSNVSLEDNFGPVTSAFSLATGATRSFERQTTIAATITNVALAKGFLATGQMCSDEDSTTVTLAPPALSCEDGKPVALVFEYTGGSCSDTTNTQNGKLVCSGTPGTGTVSVVMQKDADKIAVSPNAVAPGQRFTIARTDSREFAADTLLRVGGQSLTIHTSCSQALNVGDVFGSLRLVQFVPKGFPIPTASSEGAPSSSIFLPLITR